MRLELIESTGTVYEKRLIESYIAENARDPVNGEELSVDDLVELKTARTVKPRPPALTSIPSLLSTFQNEWDALALESFTLKQHLSQLRQELSTALYNNDAAVRVIARLTKERDEARDALSKVSMQDRRVNGTGAAHANGDGDAMQVDPQGLPSEYGEVVQSTQEKCVLFPAFEDDHNTNRKSDYQRHAGSDQSPKGGSRPTPSRHSNPRKKKPSSLRKAVH